jgi:3'-5' exoribonuclease
MEYKHIGEIEFKDNVDSRVFGIFLAQDVEVRIQKDGVTKFISLNMVDKATKLDAKKFGASDSDIEMMRNGGVYCAAIDIKPYTKSPTGYSCTIYNFEPFDESASNFLEWAQGREEAVQTIQRALSEIYKSIYKDLVCNIINNNWNNFCVWGAATGMHHNVLGGLLVHTAEVLEQCEVLAEYWNKQYSYVDNKTLEPKNFINKPLLYTGALLHDIGKLYELECDVTSGTINYSHQAVLETHTSIGISLIDSEAYKLGLGFQNTGQSQGQGQAVLKSEEHIKTEQQALSLLKHLILSHHGRKDYGACIEPNCPEAVILNKADEMSATMYRFNKNFKTMEPGTSHSIWTSTGLINVFKDYTK